MQIKHDIEYFLNKFTNMPDSVGVKATSHERLWKRGELDAFLMLFGNDPYISAFYFLKLCGIFKSEKIAALYMLSDLTKRKAI